MGDQIARRYVVSGFVQGVGFRWATARLARSFGITGTVWNRSDGSVGIDAYGAPEVLDGFERALRTETPGRVDSMLRDPAEAPEPAKRPPTPRPNDFRIIR